MPINDFLIYSTSTAKYFTCKQNIFFYKCLLQVEPVRISMPSNIPEEERDMLNQTIKITNSVI